LENVKCEKLILHFKYVALILFLMFIFAATGAWTDRVNFTEYLTNAATMISIVLGLVAIFYSFVSNTSLNQSLGNISNVSSGIEKSNQLVNQYVAQAEHLNKANLQNSGQLDAISINIKENLEALTNVLHEINDKSSQLEITVATIPDRFEKLETVVYERTKDLKGLDVSTSKSSINWSVDDIKLYIDQSTLSANLAIYACVEYSKRGIKFNISELAEIIDTTSASYIRGYIGASHAVGLFKRVIEEGEYLITDVKPALRDYDILGSVEAYLTRTKALNTQQKREFREIVAKLKEKFTD